MSKELSLDEKVAIQRAYTQIGHTIGETNPDNTFYVTTAPSYFTYLSYAEVDKMVKELALAALLGELSTIQRYMYWFLKDNCIIASLDAIVKE